MLRANTEYMSCTSADPKKLMGVCLDLLHFIRVFVILTTAGGGTDWLCRAVCEGPIESRHGATHDAPALTYSADPWPCARSIHTL